MNYTGVLAMHQVTSICQYTINYIHQWRTGLSLVPWIYSHPLFTIHIIIFTIVC